MENQKCDSRIKLTVSTRLYIPASGCVEIAAQTAKYAA
jgi:hypothetical protein